MDGALGLVRSSLGVGGGLTLTRVGSLNNIFRLKDIYSHIFWQVQRIKTVIVTDNSNILTLKKTFVIAF